MLVHYIVKSVQDTTVVSEIDSCVVNREWAVLCLLSFGVGSTRSSGKQLTEFFPLFLEQGEQLTSGSWSRMPGA